MFDGVSEKWWWKMVVSGLKASVDRTSNGLGTGSPAK